jgi:PEP-CTERM motif
MKHNLIKGAAVLSVAGVLAATTTSAHATVNFSTFVNGSDIAAAEGGNQSTIAFNYTGSGFVGSVYFGPDNNQLYSTNLSGGNVKQFGQPIPGFSGEVVVGVGLGQAGFAKGAVYAGNGAGNQIFEVSSGGAPTLFGTTGVSENIRQIFFDPGNTFGGKMLVTTNAGNIWSFDSSGHPTLIANIGADTEGMDIASSAFGPYAGDLLVASEGTGEIHAITPGGGVLLVASGLTEAETVSTVPLNLGTSGNPLEGFYVANYPEDIQKASADEFAGLQGDVIVTGEFGGGNSPITDLHWNGSTVVETLVGNLPNQSEDGIFVTAQRIQLVGTPEPSTWAMMLLGFVGLGLAGYRARKRASPLTV